MKADWLSLQGTYLDHLRHRNLSPSTLAARGRWAARFADFCRQEGAGVPAAVTGRHLARWRRRLQGHRQPDGAPLAPATLNQALYTVKQWLGWAHREGYLLVHPGRDLVLGACPHRPRRILSEAEVERLLEQPDSHSPLGLRDRAALELLYSAGLRIGECCALDLADLDLAEALLRVRQGKGGRERLLPVGECLHEALGRYLVQGRPALAGFGSGQALLLNRFGGRLDNQSLRARWKLYVARAGLAGVRPPTPHSLRHSCATHMLQHGADLRQVSAFLGHADLASTEIYTHLEPLDLMAEHQRTHPRTPPVERPGPGVLLCEEKCSGADPGEA